MTRIRFIDIKIVDIQRGTAPGGYPCIYYRFSDKPEYLRTYGRYTEEELDAYEELLRRNATGWVRNITRKVDKQN